MRMVGLDIFAPTPEAQKDCVAWAENLQAVKMFAGVGSRWVSGGMGGAIGLRWEAIYPLMNRLNLEPSAWDALLSDLEVMESAALEEMAKAR